MSRIGKLPIKVPEKVKVAIADGSVTVEGPKGKLQKAFKGVGIELKDGTVAVGRPDDSRQAKALHGLSRTLLANMVKGVSTGFERKLELYGVGFRAEVKGKAINFTIGFSHPILFPLPEGVSAEWKEVKAGDKQGEVYIRGIDKDLLGRTAAEIRALRPPEPYKGKGIKYAEEIVRRKQGKTGAA
ncbi:MAG: 50S ribosomal protein L6 [Candidatus Sericytochromatia bacterium]